MATKYVGAIDPGKKGGWAVYVQYHRDDKWELYEAGRLDFEDPNILYHTLRYCDIILIERAQSAPGQGSAFEYGRSFGRTEAACIMTGAEILYCAASWWKGKLGIPSDKKLAVAKALDMIPGLQKYIKLVSDDGVAEAALIGQILLDDELFGMLEKNNVIRVKPKKKKVSYRV